MITKNGICYDLSRSPYVCSVANWTYYFSSPSHMNKFKSNISSNREWLNDSMKRRFKFDMDVELLADFSLYRKIETRGFLIINESTGVAYECAENIEFRGMTIN
jgi:hypothetical protein